MASQMQETEAQVSETSLPQPAGPVLYRPPHLCSLPLQEHLRDGVDLTQVKKPASGASSPGASAFKLPDFPAPPFLPAPRQHCVLICAPGRVRVSRERADPNVQDGLGLLPNPLACAGAQASLPPSSHTLPAESLLGVLLGPLRAQAASHEASKAVRRTQEGDSRDAGWWAPKAQAPVGVFTAFDARGNVCIWGQPRRSCWSSAPFLPGGCGHGFFHGSSSIPPQLPAGGALPDDHSLAPAGVTAVTMPCSKSTERAPLLAQPLL